MEVIEPARRAWFPGQRRTTPISAEHSVLADLHTVVHGRARHKTSGISQQVLGQDIQPRREYECGRNGHEA